jgi:uncharacterized membrane protein
MANDTVVNPFDSPRSEEGFSRPSSPVIDQLSRTRPWVLLFAILGAIGMAFMAIGAIGMLAGAAAGAGGPGMPAGMMTMMGVMYAVFAVLYAYPIVFLFRFASRIKRLRESQNPDYLVSALDAQRGFWKSVGIMFIIGMVLYVIMMIFMVVGMTGQIRTMQPPGGAANFPPAVPVPN